MEELSREGEEGGDAPQRAGGGRSTRAPLFIACSFLIKTKKPSAGVSERARARSV